MYPTSKPKGVIPLKGIPQPQNESNYETQLIHVQNLIQLQVADNAKTPKNAPVCSAALSLFNCLAVPLDRDIFTGKIFRL